ncbi:MAG: hypothetical protein PF503_13980 [Desulfobacula sp.]|nr:hypothetical protein [Desulfobacula sp.]
MSQKFGEEYLDYSTKVRRWPLVRSQTITTNKEIGCFQSTINIGEKDNGI